MEYSKMTESNEIHFCLFAGKHCSIIAMYLEAIYVFFGKAIYLA